MRYFLLMAIILTSLCVDLPFLPFTNLPSSIKTPGIEISNEDVFLNVNVLPSEIISGGDVTMFFRIMNKAAYDLEAVNFELYDTCIFLGGYTQKSTFCQGCKEGELKSNRTYSWSWNFKAGDTVLSRDCDMKFRLEYKGKYSVYQNIVVLMQSEYNIRLMQGTLKSIPISSSSSNSPLKISLAFTETQPLLTETENDMQINYAYTGSGFINVTSGSVAIKVPDNLLGSEPSCTDYNYDSGTQTLTLKKELKFINKRASPTICNFKASASEPIDIKSLALTADYKYTIDSSIIIRVKGTHPSAGTTSGGSK
jgi:hypothetical protein